MSYRIIPRLDIKGPNLVKGIHLEGLRVLGKPWDFALKYYQDGADELIYIDAVASLYGRNNLTDIVQKTAENIFIPLTVGGGVRSIDDIRNLLRAGADKVAINTAAIHRPQLLAEAAQTFGSQCIVASIQAKHIDGKCWAFTDNGRERSNREVYDWAKQVADLGVGEILITSIDNEGTGQGYDTELIQHISQMVRVPVIACGGCGKPADFTKAIIEGKADAVCASSIFHYYYLENEINKNEFQEEGNIEFVRGSRGEKPFMQGKLETISIKKAKETLTQAGIHCRMESLQSQK